MNDSSDANAEKIENKAVSYLLEHASKAEKL